MPSPFPGMDPYLESADVWEDFHQTYIARLRAQLNRMLPSGFVARLELAIFVHEEDATPTRTGKADVAVVDAESLAAPETSSTAVLSAPVICRLPAVVTERHGYIKIEDVQTAHVVTVIELLSPSNKRPGRDREHYLAKREAILSSETHLVEIDLLRGHPRLPLIGLPSCDYCVAISRADLRPEVDVWPISLRDRLPTLPLPLTAPATVDVDLQTAFDETYAEAQFERYLDRNRIWPPLRTKDAAWVEQLLRGVRTN